MARPGGDKRRFIPAAERNREPIFQALKGLLTAPGTLLEIASGTGQHAAYLAPRLPHLAWVPSDIDPGMRESIAAWAAEAGAANVRPARAIDVTADDWGVDDIAADLTAIFNANMVHIAPWAVCQGLMAGAGRYLPAGGLLALYGPFFRAGHPPGEGNLSFDAQLRAEDPAWGIRTLEAVAAEAGANGLETRGIVELPANNLIAVFAKEETP